MTAATFNQWIARPLFWIAQLTIATGIGINVWAIRLDLKRNDWHAAGTQMLPLLLVLLTAWAVAWADQYRARVFESIRTDLEFKQTMLEKLRAAQELHIGGSITDDDDDTKTRH